VCVTLNFVFLQGLMQTSHLNSKGWSSIANVVKVYVTGK